MEMTPEKRLHLQAYYYGFSETDVRPIDLLLCAVAAAGKLFHHTDQWTSEIDYQVENVRGSAPVDWIQNAADDAAAMYKKLIAERDTLRTDNATLRAELAEAKADLENLFAYDGTYCAAVLSGEVDDED